jgi:Asp-tRNA(Asn)/Glu-tRNA(Gln) amidotransferase B subunit
MTSIETEILDERLLKIHAMWKNPPWQWVSTPAGHHATATSCFAVPSIPLYQRRRLRDEYNLPKDDIDFWSNAETVEENDERIVFKSYDLLDTLFEQSMWVRVFPQLTSKIVVQLLSSKFATRWELYLFFSSIDIEDFGEFIRECSQYEYPWKYIQDTLNKFFDEKIPLTQLTLKYPYIVVNNQNELETICDAVIKDNPKSLEDYRKGKTNSINHLKGQVMKLTKGKADIRMVTEILERKLKE